MEPTKGNKGSLVLYKYSMSNQINWGGLCCTSKEKKRARAEKKKRKERRKKEEEEKGRKGGGPRRSNTSGDPQAYHIRAGSALNKT